MNTCSFNSIPKELEDGIKQFTPFFQNLGKLTIHIEPGEENRISRKDSICEITYSEKVWVFRALSMLNANNELNIVERKKFKELGAKLDISRNAALKVKAMKKYADYMAAMGMNQLYLYIEDMFEVEGRPYFGYLRGRYTYEEFKELDDYCFNYGIEVIPCIQSLGHHYQYLRWPESYDVKDTDGVLLAESDATYEFIEKMMTSVLTPFRTKKIWLGMDEAHDLGLGKYLKINGYKKKSEIFLTHLNKVFEIAKRLELKPIISGDMFFSMESKSGYYYDEETEITQETIDKVKAVIGISYWHYGEKYGCDDYMLEKYKKFNRSIMFYGGTWTWSGHLPETIYALDCTKMALESCQRHGVDCVIMCMWGDDGCECNHFYGLPTVFMASEYTYGNEQNYKERFEAVTGAEADAFISMTAYQNEYGTEIDGKAYMSRFKGKTLFWQDIMIGRADLLLLENPMSVHYEKYADVFSEYALLNSEWKHHYEYIKSIFDVLHYKCFIAENLQKAYGNNDTEMLETLLSILVEQLYPAVDKCHESHKSIWHEYNKPFGWEVIDIRYGGLKARIKSSYERIRKYVDGEIDIIEELEEKRLPHKYSPFTKYKFLATVSYEF